MQDIVYTNSSVWLGRDITVGSLFHQSKYVWSTDVLTAKQLSLSVYKTLKLESQLKIPASLNTSQTWLEAFHVRKQPSHWTETGVLFSCLRPPAKKLLITFFFTYLCIFLSPCLFFQISHVAVWLSNFNVLYTDDDSCIAVKMSVDLVKQRTCC